MKIYENDKLFVAVGFVEKVSKDSPTENAPLAMRMHLVMAEDEEVAERNYRHYYENVLSGEGSFTYTVKKLDVMTAIGNP